MEVQIPHGNGHFFRRGGEGAHCKLCKQGLFSLSCACTSDPIEMPFGMLSQVDSSNHVLDGGSDPPWEGAILRGKGMPRHLR